MLKARKTLPSTDLGARSMVSKTWKYIEEFFKTSTHKMESKRSRL